jgi:hypothetical protein
MELALAAIVVVAFLWFCLKGVLLQQLAEKHPAKFEAMGRPWVIDRWVVESFLLRRDYLALGDPALSRFAGRMRVCLIAQIVAGSCFVLFVIVARAL